MFTIWFLFQSQIRKLDKLLWSAAVVVVHYSVDEFVDIREVKFPSRPPIVSGMWFFFCNDDDDDDTDFEKNGDDNNVVSPFIVQFLRSGLYLINSYK